jgi:hypothetical protein
MNNLFVTAGFAASMLLLAMGVSQGQIDPKFGQFMLFVLPALAVSMTRTGNRCPFSGVHS